MDDSISRKQAIDVIRAMQTYKLFAGDDLILVDKAGVMTELMMLPSAQPERKKGKWIGKYPVTSTCSECNYLIHDSKVKVFAYCPNCGADMKSSEPEIEQCCDNCKWYRSMDDYCVSCSCNIDGREKHSCFEEK